MAMLTDKTHKVIGLFTQQWFSLVVEKGEVVWVVGDFTA